VPKNLQIGAVDGIWVQAVDMFIEPSSRIILFSAWPTVEMKLPNIV